MSVQDIFNRGAATAKKRSNALKLKDADTGATLSLSASGAIDEVSEERVVEFFAGAVDAKSSLAHKFDEQRSFAQRASELSSAGAAAQAHEMLFGRQCEAHELQEALQKSAPMRQRLQTAREARISELRAISDRAAAINGALADDNGAPEKKGRGRKSESNGAPVESNGA